MKASPALMSLMALAALTGCHGRGSNDSAATASAGPAAMTVAEIKYGASPTPSHDISYQDDVLVMAHGAEAIRSQSSDGLTYTIDANAPGANDIQKDKILFATGRVVGRVLDLKRNGDGVAVTLGPVELTDVFKEAHISYHGTLDPDKMIVYRAPPDYPGTFIDQDAPDPNAASPAAATRPPGNVSISVGVLLPSDKCDKTVGVSILTTTKGAGCWGSGGAPTVEDIVLAGAHFLPDFSHGLGVSASNTVGGMTFTASAKLRLDRPDFTFNLNITGGHLNTAEVELNVSGGLKVSFKGATGGEFKNFNKITELPLDLSIPIPVSGGFAATFHQAILIQTMFTAKQADINMTGDYTLSGTIRAGIVNGKPGGTSDVSIKVNQGLGDSLDGVSLGVNGLILGYSAKFIAGIGAYSFVVGPYASLNTTVGGTRGSDLATGLVSYTCRSAEFHLWLDYGVGVAVPNFVVKVLNGILSVFSSKAAISSSYSTKLGKVVIKDIMEYIPAGCAPKAK